MSAPGSPAAAHPMSGDARARAVVIAIDGISGSGKSTTAKAVAQELQADYVDTGAMYRAVTWWMQAAGVDVADAQAVSANMPTVALEVTPSPREFAVTCNGSDVSSEVRSVAVTEAVSQIAAVPAVRAALCEYQRSLVAEAAYAGRSIVMEGRDIGTVVLPGADLKIWLVADVEARARRRATDGEGPVEATAQRLVHRDAQDATRAVSPAHMAADAILIDTTHTGVDDVVRQVLSLIPETVPASAPDAGERDADQRDADE